MGVISTDADLIWALGAMTGTSRDGLDLALVLTDGERIAELGAARFYEFPGAVAGALEDAVRAAPAAGRRYPPPAAVRRAEAALSGFHAECIAHMLDETGTQRPVLIGVHGQTIVHRPDQALTWQIIDGAMLAAALGIDVVCDFRSADVARGGQGAPLAPVYHQALLSAPPDGTRRPDAWPAAVLNIGGVANLTWVEGPGPGTPIAFDTGPGNGLMDDIAARDLGTPYDEDGAVARGGTVDTSVVKRFLDRAYFAAPPPKSLDRADFPVEILETAGDPADRLATAAALTVETVARAVDFLPAAPAAWYVTGGGRKNSYLMDRLGVRLGVPVEPVETLGWRGDFLEAELIAFLARRAARGLPYTYPGTTGVDRPLCGGALYRGG